MPEDSMDFEAVCRWLEQWQQRLCGLLERADGVASFGSDRWQHAQGGGGLTRVLGGGALWEQAGVNFSRVSGDSLPAPATEARPELRGASFQVAGVSLVLHPLNPFVPICHANLRFFCAETSDGERVWWFGGGYDLTPCYGFVEDCRHWHRTARDACSPFGDDIYPNLKKQCDDYFFLPHRTETRGVGGLFFDDWNRAGFASSFDFVKAVGNSWEKAYLPIVERRRHTPYDSNHRDFQLCRRGRYVEFNLLFDRGTRFGIEGGGRIDSILMSLPPLARWQYAWQPEPGSTESLLKENFLKPKNWLDD